VGDIGSGRHVDHSCGTLKAEENAMSERLTIDQIIQAANALQPSERQRLIEALSRPELGQQRRVTQLRGLGKEIWQGRDAQEYVNAERDAWDSSDR
jgi:hypothetical protein